MGMASHREFAVPADDRYSERTRLRLDVTARFDDGTVIDCAVFDVSTTGILIETEAETPANGRLALSLPVRRQNPATAVWRSESLIGCRFDEPLSQAAVEQLRRQSTVVWPTFGRHDVDHSPLEDRNPNVDGAADSPANAVPWSVRRRLATIAVSATASWGLLIGALLAVI